MGKEVGAMFIQVSFKLLTFLFIPVPQLYSVSVAWNLNSRDLESEKQYSVCLLNECLHFFILISFCLCLYHLGSFFKHKLTFYIRF